MKKSGQMSFADAEQSLKKKTTRREVLLAKLDRLVPWSELEAAVLRFYPKSGQRDRQPIGLKTMLRIHVAQIVYNYSDPGMEDALYEIDCLRRFCHVDLDEIPDESTILLFRHLLEEHELAKVMFERINGTLEEKGVMLKTGTIVDASLIAAPCSTKNKKGERDPEMHSLKKGNQWYFGAKLHIGVDDQSGLMH